MINNVPQIVYHDKQCTTDCLSLRTDNKQCTMDCLSLRADDKVVYHNRCFHSLVIKPCIEIYIYTGIVENLVDFISLMRVKHVCCINYMYFIYICSMNMLFMNMHVYLLQNRL